MKKKHIKKLVNNKKLIIILIIVGIIILAAVYFYSGIIGNAIMNFSGWKFGQAKTSAVGVPVILTKDNFHQYVAFQDIAKDLPQDGKILLKLYNYNSGERQFEESYLITKGKGEKSSDENVDAIITLHSKYINEFGRSGFCGTLAIANKNGDLGSEIKIGQAEFLWKYRGILKYKSCLG